MGHFDTTGGVDKILDGDNGDKEDDAVINGVSDDGKKSEKKSMDDEEEDVLH